VVLRAQRQQLAVAVEDGARRGASYARLHKLAGILQGAAQGSNGPPVAPYTMSVTSISSGGISRMLECVIWKAALFTRMSSPSRAAARGRLAARVFNRSAHAFWRRKAHALMDGRTESIVRRGELARHCLLVGRWHDRAARRGCVSTSGCATTAGRSAGCFESTAPASPSSAVRRKHAARDSRLFRADLLEPGHDAANEETAVRRGNPYRAICTDYRPLAPAEGTVGKLLRHLRASRTSVSVFSVLTARLSRSAVLQRRLLGELLHLIVLRLLLSRLLLRPLFRRG
jgi:hypothetical protein